MVFVAAALLATTTPSAQATVHQHGYLTVRDGTQLRYDVIRPDGPGPFPTLLNYEGYAAGTDASDNGVSVFTDRLLKRGYAVIGVSVRGTGCSQGQFDPFAHTMGADGYDSHELANASPQNFIPTLVLQNPYFDDSDGKWMRRAPNAGFSKIRVPVYLHNQWQDEQLPGRIWESLGMFRHPREVWANFSNGNH